MESLFGRIYSLLICWYIKLSIHHLSHHSTQPLPLLSLPRICRLMCMCDHECDIDLIICIPKKRRHLSAIVYIGDYLISYRFFSISFFPCHQKVHHITSQAHKGARARKVTHLFVRTCAMCAYKCVRVYMHIQLEVNPKQVASIGFALT